MKKIGMLVIALLIGLMLAPLGKAEAAVPPIGRDYKRQMGDYVLVMLFNGGNGNNYNKSEELRATYKQNGVYPKDDPTNPLWTVDWYSETIEVADDLHHAVAAGAGQQITFYKDGKEINTYTSWELGFKQPPTEKMTSCATVNWLGGYAISGQTVSIDIIGGKRFEFDLDGKVKSGHIITKEETQNDKPKPTTVAQDSTQNASAPLTMENDTAQNANLLPFVAVTVTLGLIVVAGSVWLFRKSRKTSAGS